MKIILAGDLHFDKDRYERLNEMSIGCDILCLTGDYLDDSLNNRGEQIKWVSDWILNVSSPVLMCSGNHDLDHLAECAWIEKLASSTVITDNSVWFYEGIKFGVVPYIGAQYDKFADCDVIVSHLPPSNTKTSMQNGEDFGDEELYLLLTNGVITPRYVLCGHVETPDNTRDQLGDVKIINSGLNFHSFEIKQRCTGLRQT